MKIILLFLAVVLMCPDIGRADEPATPQCTRALPTALQEITDRFTGEKLSGFELRDLNDELSDDTGTVPYCMANILIVAKKAGREFYLLAHIHFDVQGHWIYTGYDLQWKPNTPPDMWKFEWCAFIETVYPQEIEKHVQCN